MLTQSIIHHLNAEKTQGREIKGKHFCKAKNAQFDDKAHSLAWRCVLGAILNSPHLEELFLLASIDLLAF